MTTYEWICLVAVIIGGFYTLTNKLSSIEKALIGKVSYSDCSEKRDKCHCMKEIEKMKNKLEN